MFGVVSHSRAAGTALSRSRCSVVHTKGEDGSLQSPVFGFKSLGGTTLYCSPCLVVCRSYRGVLERGRCQILLPLSRASKLNNSTCGVVFSFSGLTAVKCQYFSKISMATTAALYTAVHLFYVHTSNNGKWPPQEQ